MKDINAHVVICGAGIAGVATAYYLTLQGVEGILLVDQGAPLSLTSDKSTEAYRNWWPAPDGAMIALMNRSIELIESLAQENNNSFNLNRRGYLYLTSDPDRISEYETVARQAETQGTGPCRIYRGTSADPAYLPHQAEGFTGQPEGCDLILDRQLLQIHFPYLSDEVVAALHTRRCGWFSAQQLGMLLLEKSTLNGVRFVNARIEAIEIVNDQVDRVYLRDDASSWSVATEIFVNAAGPHLQEVCRLLELHLPVFCERHLKVSFKDVEGVIPRQAPLLIWDDSQRLQWDQEERRLLSHNDEDRILLGELPPGAHLRPEGGSDSSNILMLWPYHLEKVQPSFPIPIPDYYPEVVLRGLCLMVPGLEVYLRRMPRPYVDGGYYTKTPENRLLAGPLPVGGAFVLGALSGYGLMAACAAAELLAAYISLSPLPAYASAFTPERYEDPDYLRRFEEGEHFGQL
jgi:glycine/D-amino acid oxidase-like deaminating enzyme